MRTFLLFPLMACSIFSSAQVDPLSQYMNKAFWPTLVAYDSITVSEDSGAAFNSQLTARQHYFPNNNIDTLEIQSLGVPLLYYDGNWNGTNKTEVTGYLYNGGSKVEQIVFYQDSLFRDSALAYFIYQGSNKVPQFDTRTHYNSSGEVTSLDVFASGSKLGDYTFYYDQGNFDSIYYTISLNGNSGYMKYLYDPNVPGKLDRWELYEDINGDGEKDLVRQDIFKHNSLNQIVELTELAYNTDSARLILAGAVRYSVRKHSTISLPEAGEVSISLYPNPAYNYLQLDYDPEVFENFEITGLNGQNLLNGRLAKRIDIGSLPSGVYVIRLKGEQGAILTKFEKL